MKKLYYHCEKCNESWIDDYDKEYGECDSECSVCGHDFSPFTKKTEWLQTIKENSKNKFLNEPLSSIVMTFLNSKYETRKLCYREKTNNNINIMVVDGYFNGKLKEYIFSKTITKNKIIIKCNGLDITNKIVKYRSKS